MRITKFFIALFAVFLLVPLFSTAHAATDKQRIFDDAHTLSDKEKSSLERFAQKYSDKRKVDFIIITMDGDEDITKYMGDLYDEKGFGYDKKHGDVALIALNTHPKKRDVQLAGFGEVEYKLPDERFYTIREKITPNLSDGNYQAAFEDFIKLSARYMQFKPGVDPANPVYNPYVQIIIAFLIGLITVGIMASNRRPKITFTAATYFDERTSKVNRQEDKYLRRTISKTYSPQKKDSGGGGSGGGFSGGGTTGGGSSFSGSRGKF